MVLLTGACGQVGSELLPYLREEYGARNVIGTDVRKAPRAAMEAGPFSYVDVTQYGQLERLITEVFYFSTQRPISPICRTPLFPISQNVILVF